ncbi:MAG: hypothetical protein WC527_05040 [Candidatus Margulisiibacteriota bacterium]
MAETTATTGTTGTTTYTTDQEQQFDDIDGNADGYISLEEYNTAFPEGNYTAFDTYDENGDGKISPEEAQQTEADNEQSVTDILWRMAMRIFKLDQFKPPDLGNDPPDWK